jgi:hypothetical protein
MAAFLFEEPEKRLSLSKLCCARFCNLFGMQIVSSATACSMYYHVSGLLFILSILLSQWLLKIGVHEE